MMDYGSGKGAKRQPPSSSQHRFDDSREEPERKRCRFGDIEDDFSLYSAAFNGDVEMLQVMLERGLDPRGRNERGATPLHFVAEVGNVEVLSQLVAGGADVSLQDERGRTAFHYAVCFRNEVAAKFLASVGGLNDMLDEHGHTPLHHAASVGLMEVVKTLLSRGARPNVRDRAGNYTIGVAMNNGHFSVAKVIVAALAINNVTIDWQNVGLSPSNIERGICMLSNCEGEIRRMRETRVLESRATYLDVVRRHPCRVAPCLPVESIRRVEEADRLKIEFPIYGELIASKLRRVQERRDLADRFIECFSRMLPPLPPECAQVVLLFLADNDLRNVLHAMEPRTCSEAGGSSS